MKWSLQQLYRYGKNTFSFEEDYDFSEKIKDIDDILDISIVHVKGEGKNINDNRYMFDINIKCNLVLECARTLEPIDFPIDMDIIEIYDTVDDGVANYIEKNTIDLEESIWDNIYLEKPMRVFKEGTTQYVDDVHELEAFLNDQDNDK